MVSGPLISGIAALIVGIIAIIIGVVISQAVTVGIKDGVEKMLTVEGPEDDSYNSWVTNNLGGSPVATRSFYIYNISNINDVVQKNTAPQYNEVGPYTYRYTYEKIDVKVSKTDSTGFYRSFYRYVFQYDPSTGLKETDELYQLNPNYIVALYGNVGPDVTSPVFAGASGILASVAAGVLAKLSSAFNVGGGFYNQVRIEAFKVTQVTYIPLILSFGGYANKEAFLSAVEQNDIIDLPFHDCTPYSSNSDLTKGCMSYNAGAIGTADLNLTGIPIAARRSLFDTTNIASFGHPSSIWHASYLAVRPPGGLPPTPQMLYIGLTTVAHVNAVFAFMDRYMDGVQLTLVRGLYGQSYAYDIAGFTQFGSLTTLSGQSIASKDPTYSFFPEYAAYHRFVSKDYDNPDKKPYATLEPLKAKQWLSTFSNATLVGALLRSMPGASAGNEAMIQQLGMTNFIQAGMFVDYITYLYAKNFLPVCASTRTGLCLYRKTTVSNMLFGTIDDPLVTFLTQGTRSRAGVFTNHTKYEDARLSSPFGDTVDVGTKEIDDVGKVRLINGANKIVRSDGKTNIWKKEVPIVGRGAQFPPASSSSYTQALYSSALFRNLNLKKVGDETVKGIKMRRFELDPANNLATAENKDTYFITQSGVMDYSLTEFVTGVPNIPILATNPRLLDVDQTIFTGIDCTTSRNLSIRVQDCFVQPTAYGAKENRDQYTTHLYIEPITGLPMKGHSVVQFWLHIAPTALASGQFSLPPYIANYAAGLHSNLHPIKTVPMPFCYLRDQVELTDKNADDFKNTIYAAQDMGAAIGVALPVIGAFLLVFSFALLYWHVKLVKEADSVGKA